LRPARIGRGIEDLWQGEDWLHGRVRRPGGAGIPCGAAHKWYWHPSGQYKRFGGLYSAFCRSAARGLAMNIFLAHASEDKETAESIAYSLRSRRHKVFLDQDDLPPGASYDQQIERAVKNSDIFIFLISPTSVAEGRYTLSELTFARQQWPDPNGHVLPVMTRKTPAKDIPPYLKAVTILEPRGNTAAETSAAVDKMRHGSWRSGYRIAMVVGVLCAITAVLASIIVIPRITTGSNDTHILPPYGLYLTGVTDAQMVVQEAEKVKSVAKSIGREGNEIRLYKRRIPGTESFLWAIMVIYTAPDAARSDVPRYETDRNKWDQNPDVVNLHTWCPNARAIPSPTGSEIKFPILDCT
jgi:hypothetical protein